MKPEEQQFALARWDGWRLKNGKWHKILPHPAMPGELVWPEPPDYLSDLNAVHCLEKKLTDLQFHEYARRLGQIIDRDANHARDTYSLHTDAAQRCEALLKTLGLWREKA